MRHRRGGSRTHCQLQHTDDIDAQPLQILRVTPSCIVVVDDLSFDQTLLRVHDGLCCCGAGTSPNFRPHSLLDCGKGDLFDPCNALARCWKLPVTTESGPVRNEMAGAPWLVHHSACCRKEKKEYMQETADLTPATKTTVKRGTEGRDCAPGTRFECRRVF